MATLRKKKIYQILLIEDNLGDVRLTEEAFIEGKLPVELTVLMDGAEAHKFITGASPYEDATVPDLILLDLNLPKKSGNEILAAIKTTPRFKRVPVIILTTSMAPSDIQKAYDNHANCYINKPVDFDSFFDVVKIIEDFWLATAMLPSH